MGPTTGVLVMAGGGMMDGKKVGVGDPGVVGGFTVGPVPGGGVGPEVGGVTPGQYGTLQQMSLGS